MKTWKTVLLAMSFCVLLSGCIRIENNLKVHDDGRVSVDQIFGVNVDEFDPESIGMPGDSLPRGAQDAFCEGIRQGTDDMNLQSGLPQNITEYSKGDYCGVSVATELQAGSDLSAQLSLMLEQEVQLTQLSDGWEFEVEIVPERLAVNRGFDISDYREVRRGSELIFEIDLPGSALDGQHNANSVSGGKFTWNIDLQNPPTRIYAQTGPTTGLNSLPVSPTVLAVIGINVVVLLGIIWYFLRGEKTVRTPATTAPVSAATQSFGAVPSAGVAPGTPYYDSSNKIWVINDPVRGKLWHREASDEWVPF